MSLICLPHTPLKLESSSLLVLGIVRYHCWRNGVFHLFDVPYPDADKRYMELSQEGWIVTHREQL